MKKSPVTYIEELFCQPFSLILLLALVICCPYLFFLSDNILIQRVGSGVLFSLSIIILAYLSGPRRLPNLILSLFTLLYIFASYCEIGNFLIKGDTFKNEFWQFVNFDAVILSFQTAPVLASVGYITPVVIGVSFYFSFKCMRRTLGPCFFRGFTLVGILFVVASSIIVNTSYSSISQMQHSYSSYASMRKEINSIQYIREIPPPSQIRAKSGLNVLHVILESFGDIYTDNNRFPGLAPNLAKYKQEGLWAANMIQTPNQANSYMGHFVTERGRYYFIEPKAKENDVSLGYVLNQAGYTNVFIRGAGANMAGPFTSLYSKENGYDTFIASDMLEKKYDKSGVSGFGFTDETLFKEGLAQYRKLIQEDTPFNLTLFTLDTHGFPQGISEICKNKYTYAGPFQEDSMVQAAHCTDSLVGNFIDQISKLPKFEDLIIVLHADHVQHTITPAIMPDSQRIYSVMFGPKVRTFRQNQKVHLMDIAPTILKVSGVETNAQFYAGNDFSVPFARPQLFTKPLAEEPFSDANTLKKFSVIDTPPIEQFNSDDFLCFQDEQAKISYIKLDGAIFSSAFVYIESKQTNPPFYVIYPLKERTATNYQTNKGVILNKNKDGYYTAGISFGVKSMWKSALLEDLTSGARWEIVFGDNAINPIEYKVPRVQKEVSMLEVFHADTVEDFNQFDQVQHIGANKLNVLSGDPKMFIEIALSEKSPHLVVVEMDSPQLDMAKLYYKINNESYSELNASSAFLKPGENRVHFFLPQGRYNERFRFDIGETTGLFKFGSLKVFALTAADR